MYKVKNITDKKISFDFDGTLSDEFDKTLNLQKKEIQNVFRQLKEMGNDVYIITKRHSPKNGSMGKINEHIEVLQLAAEMGISGKNVIFTDRQLKAETLIKMGINIHFENSDFELQYLNTLNHNVNMVMITDPYWRDLIY